MLERPRSLWSGIRLSAVFSVAGKAVGYARQMMIAYYFGLPRSLDIYFMAFNITMLLTFSYTTWFDQVGVAALVQARDREDALFRRFGGSVMAFSYLMGAGWALLFLGLFPAAGWVLCRGFSPIEHAELGRMSLAFIPWILVIFPYNAASAVVKSLRHYDVVLWADLGVSVVGTLGFFLFHSRLAYLPLTLAAGHMAALLFLLAYLARHADVTGALDTPEMKSLYKKFGQLFAVGQMTLAYQSVDRFFQSYLRPGAISACNYTLQTLSPMYEFLRFDELFVVPLSSLEGRAERLHRLLCGLLLITGPLVVFLCARSTDIIGFLYERGRFDAASVEVTARIFRVMALSIVAGALIMPVTRVLQMSGRIVQAGLLNISSALIILACNLLFVFRLGMDAVGIALSLVVSNYACLMIECVMLERAGIRLAYFRLFKYTAYALFSGLLSLWLLRFIPRPGSLFLALALQGSAYLFLTGLFYWPVRDRIRFILRGR